MKKKELNEKVQLLKAGVTVEIAGDTFYAVKVPKSSVLKACELCNLDSICHGEVEEVCYELDWPFFDSWYLRLAHKL